MNNKNQSNLLLPIIILLLLTISGEAQSNSNFDVTYDRFTDTTTVATKSVKLLEGEAARNWGQLDVQMYSGYKVKGQYGIIPDTVQINFESFGFRTFVRAVDSLNLIVNGQRSSFPLSHKTLSAKCCKELGQLSLSFKDYQALVNANSIEMQLGKVELVLQPSQIQLLGSLVSDLASKISSPLPSASSNSTSSNSTSSNSTSQSSTYTFKNTFGTTSKQADSDGKLVTQNLDGILGKWKFKGTANNLTDNLGVFVIIKFNNNYYMEFTDESKNFLSLPIPLVAESGKITFTRLVMQDNQLGIMKFYFDSFNSDSIKCKFYLEDSEGGITGTAIGSRIR